MICYENFYQKNKLIFFLLPTTRFGVPTSYYCSKNSRNDIQNGNMQSNCVQNAK